jgi:imidazolonepropionase-like amidohydrolase
VAPSSAGRKSRDHNKPGSVSRAFPFDLDLQDLSKDLAMPSFLRAAPRPLRSILFTLALAASARAQDLGLKAPPQSAPISITNATIHTVSGKTLEHAHITFDHGVIKEIAEGDASAATGKVIDAKGAHVYPGLIAPDTQLGLNEFGEVRQTLDFAEVGDITPEVRAVTAVNPDSTLIPVSRTNGILLAAVFPDGGRVPGQVSVIRLDGWTTEDMAALPSAGVVVSWPSMRPVSSPFFDRPEEEQLKDIKRSVAAIDDAFLAAQAYAAAKAANPSLATDLRHEALRECLQSTDAAHPQRSVFIRAMDVDQITAAVSWARERKLKAVIVGGRDAPLCAELLKSQNVPVIVTGTHAFPKRADAPYDDAFTLPKRLVDLGVRFCIASADRTAHERNLPYNAATAVAYGLDRDSAVKAVTLWPAQILGVDSGAPAGYGSLEVGKSATLLIASGDILETSTNVRRAWIDGREIDLSNKQSALAAKYRAKYEQLKKSSTQAQSPAAAHESAPAKADDASEPAR